MTPPTKIKRAAIKARVMADLVAIRPRGRTLGEMAAYVATGIPGDTIRAIAAELLAEGKVTVAARSQPRVPYRVLVEYFATEGGDL